MLSIEFYEALLKHDPRDYLSQHQTSALKTAIRLGRLDTLKQMVDHFEVTLMNEYFDEFFESPRSENSSLLWDYFMSFLDVKEKFHRNKPFYMSTLLLFDFIHVVRHIVESREYTLQELSDPITLPAYVLAAGLRDIAIMRDLHQSTISANSCTSQHDMSALAVAASANDAAMCEYLIESGQFPLSTFHHTLEFWETPRRCWCVKSQNIMTMLLGITTEAQNYALLLHYAVLCNSFEIAEYAMQNCTSEALSEYPLFKILSDIKSIEMCELFASNGFNLFNPILLYQFIDLDEPQILDWLLGHGSPATTDGPTELVDKTPLCFAIQRMSPSLIHTLIKHGAMAGDVTFQDLALLQDVYPQLYDHLLEVDLCISEWESQEFDVNNHLIGIPVCFLLAQALNRNDRQAVRVLHDTVSPTQFLQAVNTIHNARSRLDALQLSFTYQDNFIIL